MRRRVGRRELAGNPCPAAAVRAAVEPDLTGGHDAPPALASIATMRPAPRATTRSIRWFALESFDPVGRWRDFYRSPPRRELPAEEARRYSGRLCTSGLPVDATGKFASGESFDGIREFKALLKRDPERVARCLTEKLSPWSGTRPGVSDRRRCRRLSSGLARGTTASARLSRNSGQRRVSQTLAAKWEFEAHDSRRR